MWQELRDYWLPLLLFAGAMLIAAALLALVFALPLFSDRVAIAHPLLDLFTNDATVRRVSVAAAIGLIVTAFVFFRPNSSVLSRKSSTRKPPSDTVAGA